LLAMLKHPDLVKFGERVRQLRQSAEVSQEKLAELAELHRTYIGGIERGERNVALLNILKLAKALNASPSELLKDFE
jgi:transcriptional regulator with XRE-family HTH domain